MKASVFNGKVFEIKEMEVPKVGENDVLLKTIACGICGSDIGRSAHGEAKPGSVLGHEFVCEIVEINGDTAKFSVGDRVIGLVHAPCFVCHNCVRGKTTLCEKWREFNIYPGGFSEYFTAPIDLMETTFYKVPETVADFAATLAEPTATCIRAQERIKLHPGDNVLIIGAGTIGCLHLCLSKLAYPSKVIVSDISESKLVLASKMGADVTINPAKENLQTAVERETNGKGPDVIYVCAPLPRLVTEAVKMVRRGGTVCVFAIVYDEGVPVDMMRVVNDEVNLFGTYSADPLQMQKALYYLEKKLIPTELLLTHQFSIEDFHAALENAKADVGKDGRASIKTIITFP